VGKECRQKGRITNFCSWCLSLRTMIGAVGELFVERWSQDEVLGFYDRRLDSWSEKVVA